MVNTFENSYLYKKNVSMYIQYTLSANWFVTDSRIKGSEWICRTEIK